MTRRRIVMVPIVLEDYHLDALRLDVLEEFKMLRDEGEDVTLDDLVECDVMVQAQHGVEQYLAAAPWLRRAR